MQVFALQRQLADANASPAEVGAAAAALTDLVGEGPALQAMLNCYSHKARLTQALLLKQHTAGERECACAGDCTWSQQQRRCQSPLFVTAAAERDTVAPCLPPCCAAGSDPNSLEFAGRLVQRTLLLVAAAADTMVATFGVAQRVLGSLFTVWAAREVRASGGLPRVAVFVLRLAAARMGCSAAVSHGGVCSARGCGQARGCAGLLRHHVLAPATAASSGLTTAVQVRAPLTPRMPARGTCTSSLCAADTLRACWRGPARRCPLARLRRWRWCCVPCWRTATASACRRR